jgi:S-adenosylmethionine synthetase
MNVDVTPLSAPAVGTLPLEIVERKGVGHPDTICDALAENLSIALSRFYLEHFGAILHHNVDKGLLWAGVARPAFGAGDILEPM